MTNLMNFLMLLCASLGSMAFGILAAYAILRAAFALMRPQRPAPALKPRPEMVRLS